MWQPEITRAEAQSSSLKGEQAGSGGQGDAFQAAGAAYVSELEGTWSGTARALSPVGGTRDTSGRMLSVFSRTAAPWPAGSLRCMMQKAIRFHSCRVWFIWRADTRNIQENLGWRVRGCSGCCSVFWAIAQGAEVMAHGAPVPHVPWTSAGWGVGVGGESFSPYTHARVCTRMHSRDVCAHTCTHRLQLGLRIDRKAAFSGHPPVEAGRDWSSTWPQA